MVVSGSITSLLFAIKSQLLGSVLPSKDLDWMGAGIRFDDDECSRI